MFHLKLENKKQKHANNPKACRWKEIIKVRVEISEIEKRKIYKNSVK